MIACWLFFLHDHLCNFCPLLRLIMSFGFSWPSRFSEDHGGQTEHWCTIMKIKPRSFNSSEHTNEKTDGPYRGFGYLSLFRDPLDLEVHFVSLPLN